MGFLSNLFGGGKEKKASKALHAMVSHIHRILDDEEFQLGLLPPAMQEILKAAPAYDKDPNGSGPFGFTETNPIPVNGSIGQLAYLSRLETQSGQRILFHRLGAVGTVDVFEAVTFDGAEWFILFVDLYHPRRSRLTPDGFHFTKDLAQFSGFHNFCENFPYDFVDKKASADLSMAYIAISKVSDQIQDRVFNRPPAHKAEIDLVRSRLHSVRAQ